MPRHLIDGMRDRDRPRMQMTPEQWIAWLLTIVTCHWRSPRPSTFPRRPRDPLQVLDTLETKHHQRQCRAVARVLLAAQDDATYHESD